MIININSKILAGVLTNLSKVLASKSPLMILDNFKIEVGDEYLTMTAADSEHTAVIKLAAESIQRSENDTFDSFCINGKRFTDAVKKLGNVDLTIEVSDSKLRMATASGKYVLPIICGGFEYPQLSMLESVFNTVLPTDELFKGINNTLFAVSNQEFRPTLKGINFVFNETGLSMYATDTFVMSRYQMPDVKAESAASFIMSSKTANLVSSLFGKSREINVNKSATQVSFEADGVILIASLIQGAFPNCERVIPAENKLEIVTDKLAMKDAVNRVIGFGDNSVDLVVFKADGLNSTLKIEAQDLNSLSYATEEISCEFTGNEIQIGLGGNQILSILNKIEGANVSMYLKDSSAPMLFKENNLLMLLMPKVVH